MHPSDLPLFDEVCRAIDSRVERIRSEMHPDLRIRVGKALRDIGHRCVLWEGKRYRSKQELARQSGRSNATFGASPHNYSPCLAVDVVLDPRLVMVRAHPEDGRYPDLWDNVSAEAQRAWQDLASAARARGLERVSVGAGRSTKVDLPHLQLPAWRSYIAIGKAILLDH